MWQKSCLLCVQMTQGDFVTSLCIITRSLELQMFADNLRKSNSLITHIWLSTLPLKWFEYLTIEIFKVLVYNKLLFSSTKTMMKYWNTLNSVNNVFPLNLSPRFWPQSNTSWCYGQISMLRSRKTCISLSTTDGVTCSKGFCWKAAKDVPR